MQAPRFVRVQMQLVGLLDLHHLATRVSRKHREYPLTLAARSLKVVVKWWIAAPGCLETISRRGVMYGMSEFAIRLSARFSARLTFKTGT